MPLPQYTKACKLSWIIFSFGALFLASSFKATSETAVFTALFFGLELLLVGVCLWKIDAWNAPERDSLLAGYLLIGFFPAVILCAISIPWMAIGFVSIRQTAVTRTWPQVPAEVTIKREPGSIYCAEVHYDYSVAGVQRRSTAISPTSANNDLSRIKNNPQPLCCYNPDDHAESYLFCDQSPKAFLFILIGVVLLGCSLLYAAGTASWADQRAARAKVVAEAKAKRRQSEQD